VSGGDVDAPVLENEEIFSAPEWLPPPGIAVSFNDRYLLFN
jgi:hypothetical protein